MPARPAVLRSLTLTCATAVAVASLAMAASAEAQPPTATSAPSVRGAVHDLLILNGRIVDGTGAAWFHGDVAVDADRIVAVAPRGALSGVVARDTLDATGLVVAPGFIDIQGHSGASLLYGDSRVIAKVSQGVTTEILGEGNTPAPLHPTRSLPPDASPLVLSFAEPRGFANWLNAMESRGISINVGSFVGGSTLRAYGMAMRSGRAGNAEMADMRGALERAMQDGAFGLATALIYPPGVFAGTDELIGIARAMRPYGGLYITHMRSEGDQLLEAVDEAVRIGRDAGVPVEIYHLKASGPRNFPKGPESIARINAARAAGIDVQANMYPYPAGGTGLTSCLPPAAQEDGGLFARLADRRERARMRAEIERPTSVWENLCELAGPENVLIAVLTSDSLTQYSGQRLSQIAAARGTDWIETVFTLIAAEQKRVETLYFMMSEENVALNLQQPWMKIGTDADGPNPDAANGLVHPRSYGTYTRILGRYVREQRVLSLEEAIRKMTSATARRVGLAERGVLAPGMFADIVVFDPNTVIDNATFGQPHQVSTGIVATYVNGVAVWKQGAHTGAKPGRAVRGPGARAVSP